MGFFLLPSSFFLLPSSFFLLPSSPSPPPPSPYGCGAPSSSSSSSPLLPLLSTFHTLDFFVPLFGFSHRRSLGEDIRSGAKRADALRVYYVRPYHPMPAP